MGIGPMAKGGAVSIDPLQSLGGNSWEQTLKRDSIRGYSERNFLFGLN